MLYIVSVMVHILSVSVIFLARVTPPWTNPCLPTFSLKNHNLPTPVIDERVFFFLFGYNHSIAGFLSSGSERVFPLYYESKPCCLNAKHFISASENPDVVGAKISKEYEASRLAGPLRSLLFTHFVFSPLVVVPEKKCPGEFRLFHYLSYLRVLLLMT